AQLRPLLRDAPYEVLLVVILILGPTTLLRRKIRQPKERSGQVLVDLLDPTSIRVLFVKLDGLDFALFVLLDDPHSGHPAVDRVVLLASAATNEGSVLRFRLQARADSLATQPPSGVEQCEGHAGHQGGKRLRVDNRKIEHFVLVFRGITALDADDTPLPAGHPILFCTERDLDRK